MTAAGAAAETGRSREELLECLGDELHSSCHTTQHQHTSATMLYKHSLLSALTNNRHNCFSGHSEPGQTTPEAPDRGDLTGIKGPHC